jgi:hypothetical protein
MKAQRGSKLWFYSFFNLGARWGELLTPGPGHFTRGNDAVPIIQKAGWAPGAIRGDAENLAPTGIRPPDGPARSQSLY